jgi:hypothetical protein
MILMSKGKRRKIQGASFKAEGSYYKPQVFGKAYSYMRLLVSCVLLLVTFNYATCKYSFKDVSIPIEVKTFRVNYLENKARYVNTQLSPQLTEGLKLKIISNTRLHEVNDDSAHYDISGYVSDYSVTTTGISGNNASANRLTVSFHLDFKNNLDHTKDLETDVVYTHDFSASLTLDEIGTSVNQDMVSNLVDGIFNKIFSNW